MNAIMSDYGLPEKFPDVVEKFTNNIDTKIDKNLIGKRKDFRKKTTFTIDPRSAKDFDDAISFTPLLGNKYEIEFILQMFHIMLNQIVYWMKKHIKRNISLLSG